MKITKTTDPQAKPSIMMLVYGNGGVGKTTFASTAPKALLVDCENGAKYFGLRGIKMDTAQIKDWSDMEGLFDVARSGEYETIVIDPVGELMEKLKRYMILKADRKLVQPDGSPTMQGWGWLKDTMRSTLKILRDSGCHILINAHVSEDKDEDKIIKRPMLMTKLSDEIINMVDIVGYMEVVMTDEGERRVIRVDSASDKYIAKDRTGQLGKMIPPNFNEIIQACQGTKTFKWSKAPTTPKEPATPPVTPPSKKSSLKDKMEAKDKVVEPNDTGEADPSELKEII